jgi:translation elongation factor EF-Tu-like GTPase
MNPARDIEVQMTFLPTDAGGRLGPVFRDYRPQFHYAGADWDARHEYPDVAQVNPGDTVRAYLAFLSPAEHAGRIQVGMPFLIREGLKTVAYGVVTRVLELEESARAAHSRDGAG